MKLHYVRLIPRNQRNNLIAQKSTTNTSMKSKTDMRLLGIVYILCCVLLFTSCESNKPQPPENLIPEDEYVLLMAEFQLIEAYLKNTKDTLKAVQKTNYVLDAYDVTMDQFKSSTNYYEYDVDGQFKRVQRASDLLSRSIK